MSDLPRYGQYAEKPRADRCPKHPDRFAVGYCKRCNRPTCPDCTLPTEVGSVCVDCAKPRRGFNLRGSFVPVVTYVVLAICVAVYLLQWVAPSVPQALAYNPILAFAQPWRFVTAGFVHYGFMHLLFNMLMLWLLGASLERAAGHWRFACLYLLSALGGSIAVLGWGLVEQNTLAFTTVGASGALYGLFGAIFVQQKRAGVSTTSIVVLLAVNLLFSFMNASTVSWQAHVGGLIVGALVAWAYLALGEPRPGTSARRGEAKSIAATIGMTIVLIGLAYALYIPIWNEISAYAAYLSAI